MATIHVSSRFGNNTNNGLSANAPKKTLAAAVAAGGNPIYINQGIYNEIFTTSAGIDYQGNVNNPYMIIFDGALLVGSYSADSNNLSGNFTIQNYTSAFSGYCNNLKNIVVRNCNRIGTPTHNKGFYINLLFYDNTKNSADVLTALSGNDFSYHTYVNGQHKLANSAIGNYIKYHIYCDYDLEIDSITDLKYSLFYGSSRLKKTGGSYTTLLQYSDLQTPNCGTFAGCKVYPNRAATITNNGSGKVRVNSTAHGITASSYLYKTIRVSTNSAYLTPNVGITVIDANTFDIPSMDYVGDATIQWNEILYVNEFKKDFRVLPFSVAFMNYENPYKPIGAMPQAVEYPKTLFNLTNMVKTNDSFYLVDTNINGSLAATTSLVLSSSRLKQIYAFNINNVAEYENGKNIDNTSDKAESYAAGDTCPAGYYVVEIDPITNSSVSYAVNEKLYKSTSFTFTTVNGGILRRIPDVEWLGLNNTLTVQLKKGSNWSGNLLFKIGGSVYDATLGRYVNKMNYVGDNPSNAIEYGDADTNFRSGSAFNVIANEVQIMDITVQANAVKQ